MSNRDPNNGNVVMGDRDMTATSVSNRKCVHWHRELQPFDAVAMGEHVIETTSGRMRATLVMST